MSSSLSKKVCFNSNCKEASENWRNGWRRRTGEYAHLCDRCASAYEEGKFCEAFHSSTSGWRCCESCGKQIHCGCIVSFHMFVLLDAGGIECLTCARKSFVLTPNPAWPPPSQYLPSQFERRKDFSVKALGSIVGSGPVPWRLAPSLFKESNIQSDAQTRTPFEIDVLGGIDLFGTSERLPAASPDKKREFPDERCFNGKFRVGPFDTFQNGHAALNPKEHPYLSINNIQPTIFPKDDSSNFSLTTASSSKTELDDTGQLSATFSTPQTLSIPVVKQVGSHYRMDSCGETQVRNCKVQGDGRSRNQLLPRYRPQITEEELLQISSYSKSVITPLFEKTLSASDAGRIGRLVLPKKCAEAYFPSIAQPEGLPLKVLDVKGKEWVFQFRFWPNNNSRMYVLEGITPCIQSLRLQAGDVVTFSRLEPEGMLVMGGRKSSSVPSPDQGDGAVIKGNNAFMPENCRANNKCVEGITVNGHMKGKSPSSFQPIYHISEADIGSTTSEIHETKPLYSSKGKGSILVSKCKRLRIENDIELKLSMDEAQGLMRPPAKIVPSVFVVEGCEFEEFEETAPVIGRPTIPATDPFGKKIQWVQCEDCFKWRKVPEDALLPSGWICSENVWDLDRSGCSDAEELAVEKLEDILPAIDKVSSKKSDITKKYADMFVTQERLDNLANLAIQGDDEGISASSHSGSKHPRFPTEDGSKHAQSCDCAICSSLKHRFRTLMEKYVKHQLEAVGESASQKSQQQQSPEQVHNVDTHTVTEAGNITPTRGEVSKIVCLDYHDKQKSSPSPLKGQIDLNIQPEREEDLSPVSESGTTKQLHPQATGKFFIQQMPSGSGIGNLVRTRMQQDGIGDANLISCLAADGGNQEN
ncbi:B3 domain-containing protein Os07g0563300-like [Henckelia pumila]|uniref:B3 domain-containing protein Os07g0563300-like n=1 Tax=Henckelia pumila TaxID=405737 RepID=UPI003C6DEAB3